MSNWNLEQSKISEYLKACLEAGTDDLKFVNFKQDYRYTPILEHVSIEESLDYIKEFKFPYEFIRPMLDKIRENDIYGSPTLYQYENYGQLSPTTVRYIKNSCDIISHFGDMDLNTIVEIGGGYGGLCKTLNTMIGFEKYHIFDLFEANLLSEKYLSKFGLNNVVEIHLLEDDVKLDNIDLVISNYAFSEVPYSVQLKYIDLVFSKCKMFYMLYNRISEESNYDRGLSYVKFCEMLPQFDITIENEHNDINGNKILYGRLK